MPNDRKALDMVLVEAQLMGDLIVVNLSEDYNLLTVQVLMGFIWVSSNCQEVRYILKMDDDTYANLLNIEQFILKTEAQKPASVSFHLSNNVYFSVLGKKWSRVDTSGNY